MLADIRRGGLQLSTLVFSLLRNDRIILAVTSKSTSQFHSEAFRVHEFWTLKQEVNEVIKLFPKKNKNKRYTKKLLAKRFLGHNFYCQIKLTSEGYSFVIFQGWWDGQKVRKCLGHILEIPEKDFPIFRRMVNLMSVCDLVKNYQPCHHNNYEGYQSCDVCFPLPRIPLDR